MGEEVTIGLEGVEGVVHSNGSNGWASQGAREGRGGGGLSDTSPSGVVSRRRLPIWEAAAFFSTVASAEAS